MSEVPSPDPAAPEPEWKSLAASKRADEKPTRSGRAPPRTLARWGANRSRRVPALRRVGLAYAAMLDTNALRRTPVLRSNAKQLDRVSSQDGFLVGVAEKRC